MLPRRKTVEDLEWWRVVSPSTIAPWKRFLSDDSISELKGAVDSAIHTLLIDLICDVSFIQ